MFKVVLPITKSTKKNGKLLIQGVASDPTIDRDEERFSEEAVKSMAESVNGGDVPIKVEHENKFYSEIGIWKNAEMVGDKLSVSGELDLDLSLAKDISVLLNKGAEIGLSVGGRVREAVTEFSNDLGKSVKVYKDIILDEISVVKNPANYNATGLSLSKSFDFMKSEETEEGKKLTEIAHKKEKVDGITFLEKTGGMLSSNILEDSLDEEISMETAKELVFKSIYDGLEGDSCEGMIEHKIAENRSLDLETLMIIFKVLNSVDLDKVTRPELLDSDDFWNNMHDEQLVFEANINRFPHHNTDFTLNSDLVFYHFKEVIDDKYSFLTPKEFNICISHLYHHMQAMALQKNTTKKAAKSTTTQTLIFDKKKFSKDQAKKWAKANNFKFGKVDETTNSYRLRQIDPGNFGEGTFRTITLKTGIKAVIGKLKTAKNVESDMEIMKNCYRFKVYKEGCRPQIEGNDLGDKEISKIANAYATLFLRKNQTLTVGNQIREIFLSKDVSEKETTNLLTNNNDMKVDKKTSVEDVKKDVTEEVTPDAKVVETTDEVVEETTQEVETNSKAEVTAEETKEEEVKEEVKEETKEEEVKEDEVVEKEDGAKETTEEVVEEAVTDSSENKTGEEVSEETTEEVVEEEKESGEDLEKSKEELEVDGKDIINKALAEITKTVNKAMDERFTAFEEKLEKLEKSFDSSSESVSKSKKESVAKIDNVEKSVKDVSEALEKQAKLLVEIGKRSNVRKSLATEFKLVEKSGSEETVEDQIKKYMDNGMSFADARTKALTGE